MKLTFFDFHKQIVLKESLENNVNMVNMGIFIRRKDENIIEIHKAKYI